MGRPSNRDARRAQLLASFARVLAAHGYAGATIAAVAAGAGVAPGLVHHHFESKEELLSALLQALISGFRQRVAQHTGPDELFAYADGALKLDERADVTAARCWVGVLAEAIRSPALFRQMRRLIDAEITAIERRSGYVLSSHEASAVLAYVIGALVLGAFAPHKSAGFAAPGLRRLIAALRASKRSTGSIA
jgi:TetR/AcrR family transcriptional regulator, transcriptional repressor of bet genes